MALVGKRVQGRASLSTSTRLSLNAISLENIGRGILHDITINLVGLNMEENEENERDGLYLKIDGEEYWGDPVTFFGASNNVQYASGIVEQITGTPIPAYSDTLQSSYVPVRPQTESVDDLRPPLDSHLGQIHFFNMTGEEETMLALRANSRLNVPFQNGFKVELKANGDTGNNTTDRVIRVTARYSVEV